MRKPVPAGNQAYDAVYHAPVAPLGITMQGSRLAAIDWLPDAVPALPPSSNAVASVCRALDRYFTDPRSKTDVAYSLIGTTFQQRVWRALQAIPPGEVRTYGQLAKKLKTRSQAIGQACRANPIAVLVPCHRVVAAKGLGGYMGKQRQLRLKQWLLRHEGATWR